MGCTILLDKKEASDVIHAECLPELARISRHSPLAQDQ